MCPGPGQARRENGSCVAATRQRSARPSFTNPSSRATFPAVIIRPMKNEQRTALPPPDAKRDVLTTQRDALAAECDLLRRQLDATRERLSRAEKVLSGIYASHGWKLFLLYYRLRSVLLPPDSRRLTAARA